MLDSIFCATLAGTHLLQVAFWFFMKSAAASLGLILSSLTRKIAFCSWSRLKLVLLKTRVKAASALAKSAFKLMRSVADGVALGHDFGSLAFSSS